ncbi:cation diffusion facilitator family transporter [Hutsoniella sourekii]
MKLLNKIDSASRAALTGIFVYLFLSVIKLLASVHFNSSSLLADGMNNLTDIISSLAVFIGLYIAQHPADDNHAFGHSKYETISSFIVSLIMFSLGLNIITNNLQLLIHQDHSHSSIQAVWVAIASALVLSLAYLYIRKLSFETDSLGLKATAKDMRNDILVTLSTVIGIIGSSIGWTWVDLAISILVGGIIMYSAIEIFMESTYILTDAFDQEALQDYKEAVLLHKRVKDVANIRGRTSGSLIYVDITILIDENLTVHESHLITEDVEYILRESFGVYDIDVHVEPYPNE